MSFFLDPELADEHGLVAVGGDLNRDRPLDAYRQGTVACDLDPRVLRWASRQRSFPWYDASAPVCWWSPGPRAVFALAHFHVPRRLRRTIRSGRFAVTLNRDFAGVIRGCADRAEGTWI